LEINQVLKRIGNLWYTAVNMYSAITFSKSAMTLSRKKQAEPTLTLPVINKSGGLKYIRKPFVSS
jgi:hypothetical protein